MNQFCEMKGIKREFSVARTSQQNGVAERKNRTLIEAARTMLADLKLATTFWAEAVNTACYVQNKVLVIKPHNKTPYELFLGRKPALNFMRPFGCPVTILNTVDHLGKFNGKADEGFFVGYSTNSKAFRVFNSRTRIVEENLHVQFSENTPNIAGSIKACNNAGKARMETIPGKDYILLPLSIQDPPISSSSKDSPDAGFKPLGKEEKKDAKDPGNKDSEVPSIEEPRVNQEKDASVNNTNIINTVSPTVNIAGIEDNDVDENIVYGCDDDPNMPELEEIVYSDNDNINNLDTHMHVNPIPTTRIHKEHLIEQIIRDIYSASQTRRMTKSVTEQAMFSSVQQRTNHKDFQNYLFACFLSQEEPKKDSPFDLVAYTDNDYAGASLDRKSTIGGCQFLGCRLISWQCKKQNVVANSTTKAEYIAASNYRRQAKIINREAQLHALVDEKIIITESSVRRDLQLADEEGVDCLPNSTIFKQLTLMGPKTTAWNEFSSTMASAIICVDP
ncbi:putative ribonuclease H-like domain-containing protein [Tanacetum coccineum]